jgi:hypothetical protein
MTGTLLARIAFVISSVLVSSPPGVSMTSRTAAAPSSRAMAIPSSMYAAVIWSITPSSSRRTM